MAQYSCQPNIYFGSFKTLLKQIIVSKNALVLTSKSIEKNHLISEFLRQNFSKSNFIFHGAVPPEAPFSYIQKVYKNISEFPEQIIAIGGGSVIDMAKAISLNTTFKSLNESFGGNQTPDQKKFSAVIAVPTTFGTGAESSKGAILYDDNRKIKGGIRGNLIQPDTILIDPELYVTAPSHVKAEAAYDCFAHAIETYISHASNTLVKHQSIAAINTFFKYSRDAVLKNDINAVSKMATASMFMGFNLAYSSTCLPHRMQYAIGPITNTTHAKGIIAIHKGWLSSLMEINPPQFVQLLEDLDLTSVKFESKIEQIKNKLNINLSLSDLGFNEEMNKYVLTNTTGKLHLDPIYTGRETLEKILKKAK